MSTAPARVATRIGGKTVSGFVSLFTAEDGSPDAEFFPTGKNAGVFGRWRSGHLLPESAPAGSDWHWSRIWGCFTSFTSGEYRVIDEAGNVYLSSCDWHKVQEGQACDVS